MSRFLFSILVFLTLGCFASSAISKELIREFKGTGNSNTAEFDVEAPWIVDWRTTGDYPGQMAVQVNLVSYSGEFLGKIVTTKYVNNGVKLFNEGGRYRFQVNATFANWVLRVEQLTRAEAEQYIPKERLK